jgi:hypothetical protein
MSAGVQDLRPELTRLVTSLGAELQWVPVPSAPQYRYIDEVAVVVRGAKVVIRARTGSKGALIGATFTIEVKTPLAAAPIVMRHENWLDRLGKNLFINREFQFGDEAFDSAVYIETDVPDASLQQLLSATAVRAAIVNLASGVAENVAFAVPFLDGKPIDRDRVRRSISVTIPVSKFGEHAAIVALMDTLVQLGEAVDKERIWLEEQPKRGVVGIVTAFVLGAATWVTAWVFSAFNIWPTATIGWRAYQRGVSFGVVCWVALVALFIALFRGRSTSFRIVIALAFTWLGLLIMSGTIADRLNAQWDHAPRTSMSGTVWIRYGSKGPPHVHVNVPGLGTDVFVPDAAVDRRINVTTAQTPVHVVVGSGAFGSKWIASVER